MSEPTNSSSFWDQAYRENPTEVIIPDQIIQTETVQLTPGTALDLGCGTGEILLALGRKGWRGLGIDWSAYAVDLANQAAEMDGLQVRFAEGDITSWKTEDQFDLVISTYALPGGKDSEKTLQTAVGALKPGGILLVAEWDVSMATAWKMSEEELVSLSQLTQWLSPLEVEQAEVRELAPSAGSQHSGGKIAFVKARKPAT
ncbi:MAG: class I SAM-dependent methyltransferase [Bacteroidota bacterium]